MYDLLMQSKESLAKSAILLTGSYAALILILRISGKRTLSKMNAFDLVVTVALGSTLATISLSEDTALLQGIVVLALLVFLQFVVAWMSSRSKWFEKMVKSDPALLFHNGKYLHEALLTARVTKEEVLSAVRSQGEADLSRVLAVVLENDGTFSVIREAEKVKISTLENVKKHPNN